MAKEPNFQTQTRYTFSEYKKYYNAVLWKIRKTPYIVLLLEVVLLGITYFTRDMTYILGALMVPIVFRIVFSINAKTNYAKNEKLHDIVFNYEFYGTYLLQKSAMGRVRVDYEKIYKVLETASNFYLMAEGNQGMIIVKENCSGDLRDFIRQNII